MQYRRSDVVAWIREFFEEPTDPNEDEELTVLTFMRSGAARFPKMMKAELEEAYSAYLVERDSEREIEEARLAEIKFMIVFFEKHEIQAGMPWGEAVRLVAQRGDREAQALLREMDSPEMAIANALLEAAIDAHPAWRRDGQYYLFDAEIGGPEDSHALIDWYQRTYPHEASAMTDRIMKAA